MKIVPNTTPTSNAHFAVSRLKQLKQYVSTCIIWKRFGQSTCKKRRVKYWAFIDSNIIWKNFALLSDILMRETIYAIKRLVIKKFRNFVWAFV